MVDGAENPLDQALDLLDQDDDLPAAVSSRLRLAVAA